MKTNDIVYGVHAVTEALLANTGNKLYLQEDLRGKNVEKVKELATVKKVSISWEPDERPGVCPWLFPALAVLSVSPDPPRLLRREDTSPR